MGWLEEGVSNQVGAAFLLPPVFATAGPLESPRYHQQPFPTCVSNLCFDKA